MEYAIRSAYDEETGEVFDAHEVFRDIETAQEFRKRFHGSSKIMRCSECAEPTTVVTTRMGRVFFRHHPSDVYCVLRDKKFSRQERMQVEAYLVSKESDRHKELKNKLGIYLRSVTGVDPDSITIDDRYVMDSHQRRRPDVFCDYMGRRMAFEIQLSNLPVRYIIGRHTFYQRNQIYLVWILDDFDVHGQRQMEKDIKYLNEYQNFFSFVDNETAYSFSVKYKDVRINADSNTYHKWVSARVTLAQLKFDETNYQVFFYDLLEEESKAIARIEDGIITSIVEMFRQFYSTGDERIILQINGAIDGLDSNEVLTLSRRIGVSSDTKVLLAASASGRAFFLLFVLRSDRLEVNLQTKDACGRNLLEAMLCNPRLSMQYLLVRILFARGYELTESDFNFLRTHTSPEETSTDRQKKILRILAFNRLKSREMLELYDKNERAILTIVSAKKQRIVGLGFANVLGMANNAVHNYRDVWVFIEQAFKAYGIWDQILQMDHKGTFARKLKEVTEERQLTREYLLLENLFPEVFRPARNAAEWIQLLDETTFDTATRKNS